MDIRVILMLAAVGVFALALLYKEGLLKKPAPIVIAVMLTALALVLRALVFGYETLDYQNFLTRWVDFFRQRGGWRALSEPVGNYNIPYLYFMALFSYSSVKDLYLIKLLSTVFDVLLAYSAMRLVSRLQKAPGGEKMRGCGSSAFSRCCCGRPCFSTAPSGRSATAYMSPSRCSA